MFGNRSAGELLGQQPGKEQQRRTRAVTRHDVLGLADGIASNQDDTADGLTVHLRGVVFEEFVIAEGTDEGELLVLI